MLLRASHEASRGSYGSPRLHRDLQAQGHRVSRKRVIRLKQAEGLTVRKRFKRTTLSDHDQPVAANVLGQDFVAEAPNQRWVGDTTEFVIGSSGKLYLAALLDLYSRLVVGWAVSAINDRHLVIKALQMALKRREPPAGLLHHSDQGSPYASDDYQRIINAHHMTGSMSRRGNCYDNAVMESWFSTVKHELGEHFDSCGEAQMALFDYIEAFYNQRRRHSTLGQISPAEFERQMRNFSSLTKTVYETGSSPVLILNGFNGSSALPLSPELTSETWPSARGERALTSKSASPTRQKLREPPQHNGPVLLCWRGRL